MGNLFTSTKSEDTKASTTATGAQQPYLDFGWDQAKQAFTNANGMATPDNFVAGYDPNMLATFKRMMGFGDASPTSAAGAADALAGAGTGALSGAFSKLGAFQPGGGVQSNLDAANRYADGSVAPGTVAGIMRDYNRNLDENVIPGMDRSSAASGTLNSNRSAIGKGILERGRADQTSDVTANLRNSAFNTGLGIAENGRQNDNALGLDAIKSLMSGGIGAATAGVNAQGDVLNQQKQMFDIANAGGEGAKSADQAALDNILAQYGFGSNNTLDLLSKYWGITGDLKGTNSTGSSTSSSTESPISALSKLMMAGSSFIPGAPKK